jgi:hypothetical protein
MADPIDPFGLTPIPPGIWNDEFRGMGGLNIQDVLAQQESARAQQEQEAAQQAAAQLAQEQAARDAEQQAQYDEAQKNFVDWPSFQKLAEGTEATKQYDGYLEALAWQLQQMGYTPEEAAQEVQQFQKMVPRPAEDFGFFGNLFESAKSGASSGTRAIEAAAAAGMGDSETLARLGAENAGATRNAALTNFQQALGSETPTSAWEVVQRIASAGVREPQGLLNFFIEQTAQSYPVLATSAGLGAAGSLAGPLGTVAGVAGGAATGSTALDVGSTILDGLVQAAADRGIDPNDKAALLGLLQEPGVKDKIVNDGLAHGIPVGLMDGAIAALSFGVGASVARSVRAGARGVAGAKAVGGLGADVVLSATGEGLGQVSQSGEITDPMGIGLEGLGSFGPGAAGMVGGAAVDQARSLRRPMAPPAVVPPGVDVDEGDLPGGLGGRTFSADPLDRLSNRDAAASLLLGRVSPELDAILAEADQKLAQMQVEELPFEEIDLKAIAEPPIKPATVEEINLTADNVGIAGLLAAPTPTPRPTLAVTPEGQVGPPEVIEAEREKQRLAALQPQVGSVNPSDLESLLDRMLVRGIAIEPDSDLHLALDLIATAPKAQKQEAIASAIEGLGASTDPDADAVSLELIRIAHQLQPRRNQPTLAQAQASVAQLSTELGVPPEQVLPAITQALAQEIVDAIVTTQAATTEAIPAAAAVAGESPIQAKRGLRRGEAVPATDLASLLGQLNPGGSEQNAGGAQEVQKQPRRSLRTRVPAQGPVAFGGGGPAVGGASQGGVAAQPDDSTGARRIQGSRYGAVGTPDAANVGAVAQERKDVAAKRSLKKEKAKAQERTRSIDLAVMDKEEYEKTYPGRNYDDDLDGLLTADVLGTQPMQVDRFQIPDAMLLAMQGMPVADIMHYISSVAPNPLMRMVAREIGIMDLKKIGQVSLRDLITLLWTRTRISERK